MVERIGLLLIVAVALAACEDREDEKKEEAVVRNVPVETALARKTDLRESIVSTSTVDSRNAVDVMAEIPGTVVSLQVDQGDAVREGELLGRLSREELGLGVESARAAVSRLEAEVNRIKPLYDKGIVPRQQYDEAQYRLQEAKAEQRRASLSANDRRVVAPIDGVVAIRYVSPGQQVATGTPLLRIVQPSDLLVYVNLPEAALGRAYEGQEVIVKSDALPDETFEAVVEKVSPVVDSRTGTVRVTIDLAESEGEKKLRPGMFVKTNIVTSKRDAALAIPRRAVTQSERGTYVFVVTDGIARRRDVELGVAEGTMVEVLSGVSAQEQVVVLGKDGLKDGTAVDAQLRDGSSTQDGS